MPTGRRLSIATLDSDGEALIRHILRYGGCIVEVREGLYVTDKFNVHFQDGESQIFTFLYGDGLTAGENVDDKYELSRTITVELNGCWAFSNARVLYAGNILLAPWTEDMKEHWQNVSKWVTKHFSKYRVKSSSRDVVYVGPEAIGWKEQDGNYLFGDWEALPSYDISKTYPSMVARDCFGDLVSLPK